MGAISLDELETLVPPEDVPDDARCTVTALELRALTDLIPCAKEYESIFGTHVLAEQEAQHHG